MGRPERYGLGARWFVAYGGCRCVAATDGGSPSHPFCYLSPAGRDARASGSEGTGVGWGEEDAERNTFAHSNARDIAKHFLPIAVVCYVAFWIALAIHPLDRSDWLLENLLAVILLKGATAERRAG